MHKVCVFVMQQILLVSEHFQMIWNIAKVLYTVQCLGAPYITNCQILFKIESKTDSTITSNIIIIRSIYFTSQFIFYIMTAITFVFANNTHQCNH